MNALLTKLEAASFLSVSPSTIDRLRKAGAFPAPAHLYRLKPLFWTREAIQDFRNQFTPPASGAIVPMRKLRALRKGGAK